MAVSPAPLKPDEDLTRDPFHLLFTLLVERDEQTGGGESVAKERVDGYKSKVLEKERAHRDTIGEDGLK